MKVIATYDLTMYSMIKKYHENESDSNLRSDHDQHDKQHIDIIVKINISILQ